MPSNRARPETWDADIKRSVEFYNDWFLRFAPEVYRTERVAAAESVEGMLAATSYLFDISSEKLRHYPESLSALRMSTAPPIARDRLVGLAGVSKSLVENMEKQGRLPPRMPATELNSDLVGIATRIQRLVDTDIFPWIEEKRIPHCDEMYRASLIVADRLCDASADQIIRNAQETGQLRAIKQWLASKGYRDRTGNESFDEMSSGTFLLRSVVPGRKEDDSEVSVPVDAVIMLKDSKAGDMPLLVEAKSAGDFANTNKRRKEEATKLDQLRRMHGSQIQIVLFLCGYFDRGYLQYEAAEGIEWVWEHRPNDFEEFGL